MGRNTLFALVTIGMLMVTAASVAHRTPGIVTTIEWSATDAELWITHRLPAHDAVQLVDERISLDSSAAIDVVAAHINSRFALRALDKPLALATLGGELDGDDLYVYQTVSLTQAPTILEISNNIFDTFATTPTHQVVWRADSKTWSWSIQPGDGWQRLVPTTNP